MKYLPILRLFRGADWQGVLLLYYCSSRKRLVSRFWLPTIAAWCTRRPHTPHKEHAKFKFVGCSCLWRAVAVRM